MSTEVTGRNRQARGVAFSLYLGVAPWFWFSTRRRSDPFVEHHFRQALGIFLLLFIVTVVFIVVVAALSYTMIHQRVLYDQTHPEPRLMSLTRKLFLCWMVFWIYGAGLAVAGSVRDMPIVAFLARRSLAIGVTAVLLVMVELTAAGVFPVVVHAARLARQDAAPGKAYLIYEDINRFPRWLFTFGFYRISLAAREKWGPDSVVALRMTEEHVRRALREGHFVFIGSHGLARGLLAGKGLITPEDVARMDKNSRLQFVYLTSCDSGTQQKAWEEAFAPAKVVTYDRLTAVVEHISWLWFRGPDVVRGLE